MYISWILSERGGGPSERHGCMVGCQCRTIGTQALFDTISGRHEPAMRFLLDFKV